MIERKFVAQKFKEYEIEEYIAGSLKRVGHSHTKMIRTPLGEKVVIYTSRPGLIVGKKGQNIKKLTKTLKTKFNLDNPQIEIAEVQDVDLDPQIIAERIANSLERFGTSKFKGIGHKILADVIGAGGLGIEVVISGKIPSARAKRWRFYQGYLKKSGDIAVTQIRKAYSTAQLKTGIVGIQVRIMTPDIVLPDKVTIKDEVGELPAGASGTGKSGEEIIAAGRERKAKRQTRKPEFSREPQQRRPMRGGRSKKGSGYGSESGSRSRSQGAYNER